MKAEKDNETFNEKNFNAKLHTQDKLILETLIQTGGCH